MPIKELCRLYVSRSVQCEYCGNQRSVKATTSGALIEDHVMDLLNFEKSTTYNERQKAALAYAEAITWHLNTDDAFWDRMHKQFSEPELVELGCMIGLTLGQQSWLRLLNIEHHEVMAGTSASMAPGYEDSQKLKQTKSAPDYWAHSKNRNARARTSTIQCGRALTRSCPGVRAQSRYSIRAGADLTRCATHGPTPRRRAAQPRAGQGDHRCRARRHRRETARAPDRW